VIQGGVSVNPLAAVDVPPGVPRCAEHAGSWCAKVFDLSHAAWLARAAQVVITPLIAIVAIIIVAVILRWIVGRLIKRLVSDAGNGHGRSIVRPLKDRSSHRLSAETASDRRAQRAQTLGSLLKSVASVVIYGLAFVIILQKLGINVGAIIASAGVIGLAVAFGAQTLVQDFVSGVFMMLEDQYGVGDWVDVGSASGTVETLGLRVSTLRGLDGTLWHVRNGTITAVGNSSQHYATAVVDIPVAYTADTDHALEVIGQAARAAAARPDVGKHLLGEVTVAGVQSITPEAVTLRVTVPTKPGQQWGVKRTLNADIKTALRSADIPSPLIGLLTNGNGTG
jgi:small conductance mechanosensitive channel